MQDKDRVDRTIKLNCILNRNDGSCGQYSHCPEHKLGHVLLYSAVDSQFKNARLSLTS